ncbi:cobalamin biosynthesis protein CobD [Pseudogulbenkiania sp. NH8B]|uniref:adenosylcobinamide-phosphate synthase CbiB n=1 Tax=Pseudogulbenkiania sp. (strain NH8B) TaxID=748280 RepID=UPI0002279ED7|nr:adenosylcobinamide-phosphate synthase CbiB [Pseudogulbenkiania sp. NH8B]BAK76661.1 cobalamin biosynthesis protein CobD [Pseudogulbenkiania sp. NH8B]
MTSPVFLLLAVLLDKLFGEPPRWHPLVGFGKLVRWLERRLYPAAPAQETEQRMRLRGAIGIALLLIPFTLLAALLAWLPFIGVFYSVVLLYLAIGAKSLTQHAEAVIEALERHDLPLARQRVGMIVSRDTSQLSKQDVARATIESVLENGSDAIFAALFWFLLLGAPGAVLYRLANTLDAMWGYRNERYLHFGWAAARFDDVLNFIPARLTALTYIALGDRRAGWACWRAQAPTWYSPNAGPVMAAGAGALGVALGGAASYHGQLKARPALGLERAPDCGDIRRAVRLVQRGLWLWVGIGLLLALVTGGLNA